MTVTLGCFAAFGKPARNFPFSPHLRQDLTKVTGQYLPVASIARSDVLRFQAPQPPDAILRPGPLFEYPVFEYQAWYVSFSQFPSRPDFSGRFFVAQVGA